MKTIRNVIGSAEQAKPLIINIDTVYVHTNIKPINLEIAEGVTQSFYQYNEIQYTKDEYLQLLNEQTNNANNKIKELENALLNTINAVATLHTEYDKIQYVEA